MFGDRYFGARYFGNRYFGPPATNDQIIDGTVYVDPDTFYAATLSPGPVSITATLYVDADAFYSHAVSAINAISAAFYTDPDSFGSHTVSASYQVTTALYTDQDSFWGYVVSASYQIRGVRYDDPDVFWIANVTPQLFEFVSPGHERCMRCGFVKGLSKLKREWTGLLVCEDTCWDPRHPQMSLRGVPDDQSIPWARPVPEPVFLNPNGVTVNDL